MNLFTTLKQRILQRDSDQFWLLQFCFWSFLCVVSIFTLTLWYSQLNLAYFSHTILQALLGLLLTLPLRKAFLKIWELPVIQRAIYSLVFIVFSAFLWTGLRIETFMEITGEKNVWSDFGGWFFGSIFIFFCWAGLFHGIRYYQLLQREHTMMLKTERAVKEEQLQRVSAQNEARDAQIKMLRYQLNPHFLCNTLNAINGLIETENTDKAQKMTVQLSRFLRYSLDNNPDIKLPLENEISAMNLYLEIEKIRFGDRLQLDFIIEPTAKLALIPSLLMQPLIENSMKHVISQNESGGIIRLHAFVKENYLVLELSDNGSETMIKKSRSSSQNSRGIGIRNINDRLTALYGKNYLFKIKIIENSAIKTTIKIPFELQ